MSKYIVFHETPGIFVNSKEIHHGYINSKYLIENGFNIHTSQMALMSFDLNRKGYDIIVAFDFNLHKCKNPFVMFRVDCQINGKHIREAHNLLKIYMAGGMHSALDTYDEHLQAPTLHELLIKTGLSNV